MSAVKSDYQILAQYCASINYHLLNDDEKGEKMEILFTNFDKTKSSIIDYLKDVNYQLPLDIPLHGKQWDHFKGATALHLAIHCGDTGGLKKLIKQGADFTIKNQHGNTVLHIVLNQFHIDFENTFFDKIEIDGDADIPIILSAHVDRNIFEDPSDEQGISHFHLACMLNHVKAVEHFLKGRVFIDKAIKSHSKFLPGGTPLHIAARYCALETVEVLLKHGADFSKKDVKGMTPLHLLIDRSMKIMNHLHVRKASTDEMLEQDIRLNEKIIQLLYSHAGTRDHINLSPLQIACTMQSTSRAEELIKIADLQYSVGMDSTLWPGYTALHFAAHFSINTVNLLLKNGADIFAKDAKKMTPFDLCVERYKIKDIYNIMCNQEKFNKIKFSDGKTKLSSFVFAMRNTVTYRSFIRKIKNVNFHIPFDSPLWPGYTFLHVLIVFLDRKENVQKSFYNDTGYYSSDGDEVTSDEEVVENVRRKKNVEKLRRKLNLEEIEMCVKKGADVTAQDAHGRTPLHLAFRLHSKRVVDFLLKNHKKIINPIDDCGLSHLHIAVASGNQVLVEKLLSIPENYINEPVKSGFLLNVEEWGDEERNYRRFNFSINSGSTALHIAVARWDGKMAKILVEFNANVNAKDEYKMTPIHLMIGSPWCEEFVNILEAIGNIKDHLVEAIGLNYLHVASWLGSKKVVQDLLDHGANIESTIKMSVPHITSLPVLEDFINDRPLHLSDVISLDVVELLIEKGADIFLDGPIDIGILDTQTFLKKFQQNVVLQQRLEKEAGVTLLHFACAANDINVAKEAISNGVSVNARTYDNSLFWPGCTPLHVVVYYICKFLPRREEPLIQLLLNHGAEVTLMDVQKNTPIHRLVLEKGLKAIDHPQIVELLLKAQKDFATNPVNRFGLSHFHIACAIDCEEVVKQFLNKAVDLDCQIDYFNLKDGGSSPLHSALACGSEKSRDLLLKHHADLRLSDSAGNTPLHYAIKQHPTNFQLFNGMISAGADVMAANVQTGVTPFEMLLKSEKTPKEMIEMLLEKGVCANSFNKVTEEGYLATVFFAKLTNEKKFETKPMFEVMMASQDLTTIDDMGRNSIHNLVSSKQQRIAECIHGVQCNSAENYTSAIDRLIKIGCSIDHRDKQGRTPLHIATQSRNREAVVALLNCGANVNIIDDQEQPALAYTLKYGRYKNKAHELMFSPYYLYFSVLSSFGFHLSQTNVELYHKARRIFKLNSVIMRQDYEEIEKLIKWKVGSSSMKLYDLLTDDGVTAYTMMKYDDRLAVDEVFQSDCLRKKLPNTVGILLLRYNQARLDLQTRFNLIEPAKVSLNCLMCGTVPHVCANIILGFLNNSELQNMIDSVRDSK